MAAHIASQGQLFGPNSPAAPAAEAGEFDAPAAAARLSFLEQWLRAHDPKGARLEYAVVARNPWADYRQGGRDLDAFDRRIARRKNVTREQREAEFRREFFWLAWGFRVGRALVPVATLAGGADPRHLTRAIAEDSARGFALIFGASPDVVVRWVVTGKIVTEGEARAA